MDENTNKGSGTDTARNAGSRKIDIDGMKGEECVKKVRNALDSVQGLKVQSVTNGCATVEGPSGQPDAAYQAIRNAGYTPKLSGSPSDKTGSMSGQGAMGKGSMGDEESDGPPMVQTPGQHGEHKVDSRPYREPARTDTKTT